MYVYSHLHLGPIQDCARATRPRWRPIIKPVEVAHCRVRSRVGICKQPTPLGGALAGALIEHLLGTSAGHARCTRPERRGIGPPYAYVSRPGTRARARTGQVLLASRLGRWGHGPNHLNYYKGPTGSREIPSWPEGVRPPPQGCRRQAGHLENERGRSGRQPRGRHYPIPAPPATKWAKLTGGTK